MNWQNILDLIIKMILIFSAMNTFLLGLRWQSVLLLDCMIVMEIKNYILLTKLKV